MEEEEAPRAMGGLEECGGCAGRPKGCVCVSVCLCVQTCSTDVVIHTVIIRTPGTLCHIPPVLLYHSPVPYALFSCFSLTLSLLQSSPRLHSDIITIVCITSSCLFNCFVDYRFFQMKISRSG